MTDTTPTTVADGFTFLEGPRWHDGRVWFSDFYTHTVHSAREDGSDLRLEAEVPQQPSGLGWLPDGRLLVVSMIDKRILRREPDGTLVTHADLSAYAAGPVNDMTVDARGRAYVGNFGYDLMAGAPLETAPLVRVDPDGTVTEVATGLWFANGIVITDDGTLVVNETFGFRMSAFDVTADGGLTNHRTFAEFAPLPAVRDMATILATDAVMPDGSCLDSDGAVWVADAAGSGVLRVVDGGEVTDRVDVGSPVFACALGGADGKTLFACAAPDFDAGKRSAAREGRLLSVRVSVPAA